uniref:Uncharacterized protein n=1 Tax=viral metagenome TaxID=1070528 RepID=A0A6C0E4B3_9ZZZZ
MSIASKASKVLTNKMFLYFVFFLAITTVFGYLMTNKLNAVVLFALIGILMYQFSKNMAVVLLVCVLATNLAMSSRSIREGLENAETPKKKTSPPSSSSNNDSTPIVPVSEEIAPSSESEPSDLSGMESMKNKNNKKGGSGRIDYASTLEEAYDNLDQILGGDGIKNLTNDTQKLMAKQQELFQSMQAMTPMLNQAKQMLEGFDMKSLEGLAGLASSFTSSVPAMPSLPTPAAPPK